MLRSTCLVFAGKSGSSEAFIVKGACPHSGPMFPLLLFPLSLNISMKIILLYSSWSQTKDFGKSWLWEGHSGGN